MSRERIADWAIAVGVAAILLSTGLSRQHSPTDLDPLGYASLVGGGLALAARRWAPVAVLVITGACALGYQAVGFDVPAVAYLFAVYAAVRAGHRMIAAGSAVILLAGLPLAALASLHDVEAAFAQARGALELAWLIAAGAAGKRCGKPNGGPTKPSAPARRPRGGAPAKSDCTSHGNCTIRSPIRSR